MDTLSSDHIEKPHSLKPRTIPQPYASGSLEVGDPLFDVHAQPAHGSSFRAADFQRRRELARFDQPPKSGSGHARHLEHFGDSEKLLLHSCRGCHSTFPFSRSAVRRTPDSGALLASRFNVFAHGCAVKSSVLAPLISSLYMRAASCKWFCDRFSVRDCGVFRSGVQFDQICRALAPSFSDLLNPKSFAGPPCAMMLCGSDSSLRRYDAFLASPTSTNRHFSRGAFVARV